MAGGYMTQADTDRFNAMRQHEADVPTFPTFGAFEKPQPKELEMALIPEDVVTTADMVEWNRLKTEMAKMKPAEMLLRTKIYRFFFKTPVEGTNKHDLEAGWVLKAGRVIDRKVDLPVLQAISAENGPLHMVGVRAADLIEWEPKLKLSAYRLLTEEQRDVFDQCLTIKDGSPSLEIVLPAAAKKAQANAAVLTGTNSVNIPKL